MQWRCATFGRKRVRRSGDAVPEDTALDGRRRGDPPIAEKIMRRSLIGRLGRSIVWWHQVRAGILRLDRLDDRMLADIGITRAQIYRAATRGRER